MQWRKPCQPCQALCVTLGWNELSEQAQEDTMVPKIHLLALLNAVRHREELAQELSLLEGL